MRLSNVVSGTLLALVALAGTGCASWNATFDADHVKTLENDTLRGKPVVADLYAIPDTLVVKQGMTKFVFEDLGTFYADASLRMLDGLTQLQIHGGPPHRRLESEYLEAVKATKDNDSRTKAASAWFKEEKETLEAKLETAASIEKAILEQELAILLAWKREVATATATVNPKTGSDSHVKVLQEVRPTPDQLIFRPTMTIELPKSPKVCKVTVAVEVTDAKGSSMGKGEATSEEEYGAPGEASEACQDAVEDALDDAVKELVAKMG